MVVLPQDRAGPGHAHRRGDRGGRVSHHKGIGGALRRLGKAGQAAQSAQRVHLAAAPCEDLMDIALVPHIENQAVTPGVKNPVDGHGQLHHAQIGGQMSPGTGDRLHQAGPQPGTERRRLAV